MLDKNYFDKLKDKYNYDEKTIRALASIIPNLIDYYGSEELVLEAILNTKILPCNSYQTINKIAKENKTMLITGSFPITDIDIKRNEGVYLSDVSISYDEESNSYNIDNINRLIVTSHTFNYDSPKGLEVLTYALCKLIKSYQNEYIIKENILTKRYGICEENYHIIKDKDKIYLETSNDINKALEEGFTIYDTEKIVSSFLEGYKCYDYHTIHTIADILKDKFKYETEINKYEVNGDLESFNKLCDNKMDILSTKCNECLKLEDEMFVSMLRQDKDEIAKLINKKLTGEIFNILINIYETNKKETIKK